MLMKTSIRDTTEFKGNSVIVFILGLFFLLWEGTKKSKDILLFSNSHKFFFFYTAGILIPRVQRN